MVERALFTTQVPVIVQDPDTGGVTLGVRWFSDQPGQVVAIRFYKGGAQGGNSHTVRLYNAAGAILATAVSSGETSAGWQRVNLAAPVPIAANTEYRAAVFWPAGRYAASNSFFTTQHNNPPLHAYGSSNGVYAYAGSIAFPTSTWQASNYFVDPIVEIETASPPPIGSKTLGRGLYPLREPLFLRTAAPPPPPPTSGFDTTTYTALRNFYVSPTGSDSNPGTESAPFRTINHVNNLTLQPGDCINVLPGTYEEQLFLYKGGNADTPTGYVVYRSTVQGGALIRPTGGYSAVNIGSPGNYIIFDGFDVQAPLGPAGHDGHGIQSENVHHCKIINNISHDNGGSGIAGAYGEFYLIQGNVCYGNAGYNDFHTSGISIFGANDVANDTTKPGFRNIIRNNICYNNIEIDSPTPHTDGNGIIIDDFENHFTRTGLYPYTTLVEGNLCFNNGSKGIQVFFSQFITVRNNTCWHNHVDQLNTGTWRGELSNAICDNNTWINNVAVCDPGINVNNRAIDDTDTEGGNVNVVWYNNLTFNGTPGQSSIRLVGSNPSLTANAPYNNIFGQNPLFVNPTTDPGAANFRLDAGSPALNAGTDQFGLYHIDLDGNARIVGASIDLGCYQRE
jgi:parallel beta-helix repeat protein